MKYNPFIENLTQRLCSVASWYVDDAYVVGKFAALQDHIHGMMVRGPLRGYFLDPTKSILVVSLRNTQRAEEYFRGMGVRMVTGRRYLRGFIGNPVL